MGPFLSEFYESCRHCKVAGNQRTVLEITSGSKSIVHFNLSQSLLHKLNKVNKAF